MKGLCSDENALDGADAFQLPPLNLEGSHGRDSFAALVNVGNDTSTSSMASSSGVSIDAAQHSPRPTSSVYSVSMVNVELSSTLNSPASSRRASVASSGASGASTRPRTNDFFNARFFTSYRGDV